LLDPVARDEAGVVAGAAGEDQHRLHAVQHLRRGDAEQVGTQGLRAADHLQRRGQRLRLLEDFLLHVVRVVAQLDVVGRERAFVHRAVGRHVCRRTVSADYSHAIAPQFGDVAVFEVDHAPRHLQQGRGVGSGIVAVVAEAQQQGRAMAGDDDAVVPLLQHGDRIGADQARLGQAHGFEQVGRRLERVPDQVGDHLGVGVRGEDVTFRHEFCLSSA
jgi:hypothetical protein